MSRLEGVVKAKTADGRNQAYVMSALPFALVGAIHLISPKWLQILFESALGFMIVGLSAVLWLFGFVAARRILAVDP
jgi:tight adherence protein B